MMTKRIGLKTEKRPAKVGERILITKATITVGQYCNGDVRTVSRVEGIGVNVEEHSTGIFHSEYEVIVAEIENGGEEMNAGIIEKMQAEINELKMKVGLLECASKIAQINEACPKKTPQQQRDEIVAKAKRDVDDLESHGNSESTSHRGNTTYNIRRYKVQYVVNSEKRTVVALIRGRKTDELFEKSIAKCAPNDCFNSHIGKAIALRRALGLPVPSEYLSAPQPTETRVGDLLAYKGLEGTVYEVLSTKNKCGNLRIVADIGEFIMAGSLANGWDFASAKIIDDSREKVTK